MLVFAPLSPSAVLVGLALWLHWQRQARWRWIVAGLLLLGSWAGLVLLWEVLADQLVALREAITSFTGVGTLLMRALLVWGEGTLLGPTIAGLVHLFRPQKPNRSALAQQPAQPALPEQPAQTGCCAHCPYAHLDCEPCSHLASCKHNVFYVLVAHAARVAQHPD